ncbi:hypothetical protein HNR33_004233 [Brassicibacter mesophilus]
MMMSYDLWTISHQMISKSIFISAKNLENVMEKEINKISYVMADFYYCNDYLIRLKTFGIFQ